MLVVIKTLSVLGEQKHPSFKSFAVKIRKPWHNLAVKYNRNVFVLFVFSSVFRYL